MARRRKCQDCWWFNQRSETTGVCINYDWDIHVESEVPEYTCFKDRELCNKHGTLKELCEKENIEYIDYIKDNDK